MGVPKRKVSKQRKRQRRAHWRKINAPTLIECPQCHALIRPHRICPECGYYKNREVLKVE